MNRLRSALTGIALVATMAVVAGSGHDMQNVEALCYEDAGFQSCDLIYPPCNQQCDYGTLCRYLDGIKNPGTVPTYSVVSVGKYFMFDSSTYVCGDRWKCRQNPAIECKPPNPPAECGTCDWWADDVFMCKDYRDMNDVVIYNGLIFYGVCP